jgi:hypothetical protein
MVLLSSYNFLHCWKLQKSLISSEFLTSYSYYFHELHSLFLWLFSLKEKLSFAAKKSWLCVLNDICMTLVINCYFESCVKIHSHVLVRHVTYEQWGDKRIKGVKIHHFYFIYTISMTNDKVAWTFNYHYDD